MKKSARPADTTGLARHGIYSMRSQSFTIESAAVGSRFEITVSLPAAYHAATSTTDYPVVYATDGNQMASIIDIAGPGLLGGMASRSVQPLVQVSIGYHADEELPPVVLRNRDLVPAGEGRPAWMPEHVRTLLGVADGLASESVVDAFFVQQQAGDADKFLTFIEDELHPEIVRRYRVRPTDVGLFGHSYGGLFTLYALTSGCTLFDSFGASSPGVVVPDSRIYALYEELRCADRPARSRHLHLTVSDYELLGPVRLYRALGIELLRMLDMFDERPLPGLSVTTDMVRGEGHKSARIDGYRSFLRACYPSL